MIKFWVYMNKWVIGIWIYMELIEYKYCDKNGNLCK